MTDAGWTAEKPTEAGFYWWRGYTNWKHDKQITTVVLVTLSPAGFPQMEIPGVFGYHPQFNDEMSEFLGPITPIDRAKGRAEGRVEGLREGLVKIQERVDFYAEQEQQSQGPIRAGRGLQRNEASGCAEELARLIEQAAQGEGD